MSREVKRTSKKALSLLLAVVMVMTSMSVCFGTFSFTAGAAWEEYDGNATLKLSTLLEGSVIQSITNANNIGNDGSVTSGDTRYKKTKINVGTYADYLEVKEAVIYLHKAITESANYKNITSSSDDGNCVTMTAIKAEIIPAIESKKGGALTAGAKEFISYVLDDTNAVKHSDKSTSKVNGTYTNTLTITVNDYKGYLETIEGDYKTVGAYDTQLVYSLAMTGKDGSSNLTYKDGCTSYYHHYFWNNATNDPGKTPPTATTSTSAKDTLANYVSEVENWIATYNFNKMAMMGTTDIDTLKDTLDGKTSTIKAYIADNGEGKQDEMYDQFFPGITDKINAWKKTADDAKNIAIYSGDAKALAEYMDSVDYGTFNWGAFNEATIRADYANFTTTYQNLLNNETVYTYFVEQGMINDAAVKNFRDNVVAFDLEDTKEAADALYAKYKDGGAINPDLDGEEENPIKPEVDAGLLTGYINSYNGYTAQVKNAIFPDGIEYLLKLQEEFECTVSDCIVYFAEHAYLDYTDTKTDAVIAEIETANNQLAALEALRATVDYSENLDLLAPVFELAEEFIDYLYTLLADRFALQVTNADAAYTEIGRPTANLTLEQFSKVNGAMSAVEDKILTFLDDEGKGSKITAETRALFAALETNFEPAYNSFKQDRAFDLFEPSSILIRREDNKLEYFRENADLDNDGKGEYEVTDENVMEIINLLEGALKDPTVAKLLGDLINKDEDGNPTGEAFDLANLINGLLEKIYTDDLLNTIMSFLYPIIGKAFADVWATLPEDFTTTAPTDMGDALVESGLALDDVDTAIGNVGIALSPLKLAEKLSSNATYKTKYKNVIDDLYGITTKTHYDADGNYVDPWKDARLYTDKIDENGKVVIDEKTGEAKQVYKLEWGITDRASFIDAASAALSGLEPLLYALLLNQPFVNANTTGRTDVRGCKIGTSKKGATATVNVSIVGDVVCDLTLDPITLYFTVSGNDGYSNVLAPIFEVLGLTNIPKSSDLKNTKDFLEKGLFAMIDQLVAKVSADPIETILGIVPNLVYALEADLVAPLLDLLQIEINYEADAAYAADIPSSVDWITGILGVDDPVLGAVQGAMKSEEPILINVGQMIDLKSMGVNLSGGLKGILDLVGIELPELDTGFLAKAGELTWKASNRTKYTYTYMPEGASKMQAAYINADKADVLVYLVKWAFENLGALLTAFGVDTSSMGEVVVAIFDNLAANSHDAVAAIVELLNQEEYDAKEYNWFDGDVDGESVVGNSAYEIYLNPNNDWTKEKAEYLYNNLDALLTAALTMAGVDFDLGTTISGAIDGLLTDKTLTALAALLAKLDLNALLAKEDAATEGEEAEAEALDVNALVKTYLGLDLAAVAAKYADIAAAKEADPEYVYDFGVDAGEKTFAAVLAEMLEPLDKVLAFILDDGNLDITIGGEKVTLLGANGYNNAIIPLLEALGCTIPTEGTSLEKTINALLARIDALTTGDVIKNIIDLLPGVFYFITSNGLSTAVMNLLQPVLVIVDTIRPVFDVMALINDLKIGDKTLAELLGGDINLKKLDLAFIFDLLPTLVPAIADLDLTGLKSVIYDICNAVGTEYESASTLVGTGKKGAYTADFDQADLLTVVLSFVLEWATIEDNAKALDEMLGTNGIIAGLNTVFAEAKIEYGTPDWMYWFKGDEAAFDAYIESGAGLPNTLASLTYPEGNDWTAASADYFADNLAKLADKVVAMIEIEGVKYESVSALLNSFIADYISADTINMILDMLKNVLANVDDTLLGAGYLLDVDLVGLKNYTCTKEITTISEFVAELADILDTYAPTLVNLLFFGDDIRLAKKADKTDTIVINGGLGYEKGLALILEALGCKLPEVATTKTVLDALAARVEAILADPVNEVLDLLPNLVYFLNANGAGVAVDNILAPVYAIIDKLAVFGVELNLADLLGFDLKYLSLADILALVEEKAGIDLSNDTTEILTTLCLGKIEKAKYGYKMTADRADTVTVVLTLAVNLLADEDFTNSLNVDVLNAIKTVFASVPAEYEEVKWQYVDGVTGKPDAYLNEIYGTDWDRATAEYLAENLPVLVDTVVGLVSEHKSLSALLTSSVNIFTTETLNSLIGTLQDLVPDMYKEFLSAGIILNVNLDGLMAYTAPEGIDTLDEFAAELANILNKYAKGLVEWLLLGEDYTFFVQEAKVSEDMPYEYNAGKAVITLNGANGYSEGLALLLEALGVAAPAVVYTEGKLDTEATLKAVFAAIAARINAIFANPVEEVLALLPNVIYFLNSNGVATVIDNTIAAVTSVLAKLEVFNVNLDINELVNLPKLMGIEDKGAKISLDNLTVGAIIEAVGFMLDLDLSRLDEVLNPFAIGSVEAYDSISSQEYAYKMTAATNADKADMITVILGAALRVVFENKANTAKIEEMIGTDILSKIKAVFEDVEITYTAPEWNYIAEGKDYVVEYPTNWTEDTAKYVAAMLPEIADLVAGIIDNNYDSIEALLKDKVNVFTADTLNSIVGLLKNIIPDMYKELLGVGVILDVNINGLLDYECDKEFATVNEFAAELANILSTYIPGVIEWLLLGKDFTFFVEADAQGDLGTMITINGANGYSEGLALLLEALGCQNLPTGKEATADVVAGVLDSVANLINAIFADPVTEVLALLPNLFYFLNTNGVAAVVDNTIAAVTALLDKLAVFGVELDINALVNLPKLMGIEGKGASISLDNLSMKAILEAVGLMTGLKLGKLEELLVGYDLGKLVEYDSVSTSVGTTYKMTYGDEYKVYDMITVIANAALIVFTHKDNEEVVKGLIGEDIYKVITNFLATAEIEMQDMDWLYKDKVGTVFSAMERSEEYAGFTYGQLYTETHAEYIADNFPVVVDNVIELLGLEAGSNLNEVLNNLIDGSIYKSDLVITVRDALAGVLDGITKLEVGGVVVGGYIAEVLKTAGIADLNAVAKVEVPEFTADKEQFVASLCDVLEPLYPILKYVLANKDITFFVADNGTDALVTLTGAEGYVYGIIPLLEALGCEGILAPEAYYAGIDANADTLITSIINPLLNKVDKILAAPADEILALLPNLVYFINSNGIDTVVKNTLNAVYAVLAKIQPIAAIDLYELIGIDLATIDFEWILNKVLELLAGMGYEFEVEEIDYVSELTVGKLEKYTSLNGKEAYRMVYTPDDAAAGDKAEMVTTIERLVITFITDEQNQAMVVDFLQDNLGMGEAGTKFVEGTIDVLADCAVNTSIGMELALMSTYYVFYGVDTGVQGTVDGMDKLDDAFNGLMDLIEDVNPDSYDLLNKIFGKIDPDGDVFNPGNDGEDGGEAEEGGIAANGLVKFFQKISTWFSNIGTWFKNLFSFNFLKR